MGTLYKRGEVMGTLYKRGEVMGAPYKRGEQEESPRPSLLQSWGVRGDVHE